MTETGEWGGLTLAQALEIAVKAKEKYDACPECGEAFINTNFTKQGEVLFVHKQKKMFEDGCCVHYTELEVES